MLCIGFCYPIIHDTAIKDNSLTKKSGLNPKYIVYWFTSYILVDSGLHWAFDGSLAVWLVCSDLFWSAGFLVHCPASMHLANTKSYICGSALNVKNGTSFCWGDGVTDLLKW